MTTEERTYRVDMLTRVEGEGRFVLRVEDGIVISAELSLFEAPRFFEALLRGRAAAEVPDIVARICGICPVAYQMSALAALEQAMGAVVPSELGRLRRLLYCGEWIESHALHVFMLHAPDYLGYPSAIEMARDHRALVEQGLLLKKAGNHLIEVLGGRATHPVSPRLGGFTKVPTRAALTALVGELEQALAIAEQTTEAVASWSAPELDVPYVFVALDSPDYPLEQGAGILIGGPGAAQPTTRIDLDAWDTMFVESHLDRSNALYCHLVDGTPYLAGPQARLHHHAEKLHPRARALFDTLGMSKTVTNPYRSIVVRCLELVHAVAEALDLIAAYAVPARPFVDVTLAAGVGFGATEAPRGLLVHRYVTADDGTIADAKIVPPTSQNQARIERDLAELGPTLITLPHAEATHRCEQLIRAYDPCISCAAHFLRLEIDRGEPIHAGAQSQ